MKNPNEIIQGTKGVLTMLTGLLAFMVDAITELVVALVVLMFLDYLTGMIASYLEKKWDSYLGIKGVIKKVGFVLLVMISVLTDYVVLNLGEQAGITLGFSGVFTLAVTCWLISTELLSITENLGRVGVPIPVFLKNAFVKLSDASEKIGEEEVNILKVVKSKSKNK